MKKFTHEDHENFRDVLSTCIEIVILMSCIIFTVFVWVSCHHIEEVLNFLCEKVGLS